jgi:hypothetical protein
MISNVVQQTFKFDVFISYSRKDGTVASKLEAAGVGVGIGRHRPRDGRARCLRFAPTRCCGEAARRHARPVTRRAIHGGQHLDRQLDFAYLRPGRQAGGDVWCQWWHRLYDER